MKRNILAALGIALIAGIAIVGAVSNTKKASEYIPETKEITPATSAISGNVQDLDSFSILPGDTISGVVSFEGVVKNNYFFEGVIVINILDVHKNLLQQGFATAKTEWMTIGPVSFAGDIDISKLPNSNAFIELKKNNPSETEGVQKSIFIPVIIKN